MSVINISDDSFDFLEQAIKEYGDGAEDVISEILHGYGAERIDEEIKLVLPESGRTWKGKKAAAKRTNPFTSLDENLAVTVKNKAAYSYLYFPNDGSDTRNHIGGQEFMWRGALAAQGDIIDRCLDQLVVSWWKK